MAKVVFFKWPLDEVAYEFVKATPIGLMQIGENLIKDKKNKVRIMDIHNKINEIKKTVKDADIVGLSAPPFGGFEGINSIHYRYIIGV